MKSVVLLALLTVCAADCTAQWKFTRSSGWPDFMYVHDTSIFIRWHQEGIGVWCPHSDLRFEGDTGIRPGETDKLVTGFAAIGDTLFAGGTGLYRSGDNGRHWTATPNMFPYGAQNPIAIDTILLFTYHRTIVRSTDHGYTRTVVADYNPGCFAASGGEVYAASTTEFYRSSDTGKTWAKTSDQGADYMVAVGQDVFCGRIQSADAGDSWHDHDSLDVWALATDGSNVFAAGHNRSVYASSDRGRTWLTVDANGLPGWFDASAICVFDSFVYVGGYDPVTREGTGLYYRPISEILPKSAVRSPHTMPVAERLDVYPNPFGTSCTARFTLDAPSDVRVSLFDATGREVRTVFGGTLQPGLNTLPIDGTGLADGVYWCRLAANGSERVAKLSLIRR